MTDALLVNPFEGKGHTGLSFIHSYLKSRGYEVNHIDFSNGIYNAVEAVGVLKPKVVGLPVLEEITDKAAAFISFARDVNRREGFETTYVIGGPEVTTYPFDTLTETGADFGVIGDGLKPMEAIIEGEPDHPGIARLKGMELVSNGFSEYETELWELDPSTIPFNKNGSYNVITSVGCPNRCGFCQLYKAFPGYRPRPVEKAVEDMARLAETRDVKKVIIGDDNFLVDPERVVEIRKEMYFGKRKAPKRIAFMARADSILESQKVLEYLARGICGIDIGAESFHPAQLKRYRKGTTPEQNHQAVEFLRSVGILPRLYMILVDRETTLDELFEISDIFREHPEYLPLMPNPNRMGYYDHRKGQDYPDFLDFYFHSLHDALSCGTTKELINTHKTLTAFMGGEKVPKASRQRISEMLKMLDHQTQLVHDGKMMFADAMKKSDEMFVPLMVHFIGQLYREGAEVPSSAMKARI